MSLGIARYGLWNSIFLQKSQCRIFLNPVLFDSAWWFIYSQLSMLVGGCCEERCSADIGQSEAGLGSVDQSEESPITITRPWFSDSVQGTASGQCSPPTRVFFWISVTWSGPSPYLQLGIAARVRRWSDEKCLFDNKLAMSFISDKRDAIPQKMWQAKSKHKARPLSVLWKVPL